MRQAPNKFTIYHEITFDRDELGVVKTNSDGSVKVNKHHLTLDVDFWYDAELAQELTGLFPLLLKIKQYIEENHEASGNSRPVKRDDPHGRGDSEIPRGSRGEHFGAGSDH